MGIAARNISKTFGGTVVLDAVDLDVEAGRLTALLGPSGSGKTTLLRIIAGLETSDPGGEVRFHGEDVAGRRVQDRRVGFVFQHYALFRNMTVAGNVAFGLEVRPRRHRPSRDAIRGRVRELLELVQLDGMADRYPDQLSGGQRQRVALARALAVEPRVLLLDEPFGALDAKVRKELRSWLRRLHEELQVTSLLVTHDQDEALEVADRVAVMNGGRIEQTGTPDDVFHHPATEFVMEFLGDANVFQGRVSRGRVSFASLEVDAPGHRDARGLPARIFVRPHDLAVDIAPWGRPSMRATIDAVHSAGPSVRLDMTALTGDAFVAEIPLDRFRRLDAGVGDVVYVSLRSVRVFTNEAEEVAP